ncbi:MAG: DUF4347 domain-containing protein, partial [Magnetococcales bacterium]|nr:DUF4347 domain-containing protein [Magnetococcales bacterium]
LIFIDSSLNNFQSLVNGLPADQEVILLDSKRDGLGQIATALSGRSGLDAIHLFSHGSPGALQLGSLTLNSANLASHTAALATIGASLSADGDLLLYGCDVAAGDSGLAFINALARATGADIAASNDLTGAARLGGDWDLEVQSGVVRLQGVATGFASYDGMLALSTSDNFNDNILDTSLWISSSVRDGSITETNGVLAFYGGGRIDLIPQYNPSIGTVTIEMDVMNIGSDASFYVGWRNNGIWTGDGLPGEGIQLSVSDIFNSISFDNPVSGNHSSASINVIQDQYYHIKIIDNGINVSIYVNQELVISATDSFSSSSTKLMMIGRPNDGWMNNTSYIDNFTIIQEVGTLAPANLDLSAADDTGTSSSDNITKNTSALTISGNGQVNASVTLFDDKDNDGIIDSGEALATVAVSGNGNWTVDCALAAGTHTIKAIQTDIDGNSSAASAALMLTVDSSAPTAPTGLDLAAADDGGSSNSDNVTSQTSGLTISGSGETGARLTLFEDQDNDNIIDAGELRGTAAVTGGVWSTDIDLITSGSHAIKAIQTDIAGNNSVASAVLSIVTGTPATDIPAGLDLASSDDSGPLTDDNITSQTGNLTISGSGTNGMTVTLFRDVNGNGIVDSGESLGTTSVSNGSWSKDITLAAGTHRLRAVQGSGGSNGTASRSLSVVVDTTAPATPTGLALLSDDDDGPSNSDGKTSKTAGLTFTCSGEVGAVVTVFDDKNNNKTLDSGELLGTATITQGGWLSNIALAAGSHSLRALQTDRAGHASAASDAALTVVVVNDGNDTLATALNLGSFSTGQGSTFNDFVGTADGNDYYRFTTSSSSQCALFLMGMSGNADLQLLNSSGNVVTESKRSGANDAVGQDNLPAGSYYVRVFGSVDSAYTLALSLTAAVSPSASLSRRLSRGVQAAMQEDGVTVVSGGAATGGFLTVPPRDKMALLTGES